MLNLLKKIILPKGNVYEFSKGDKSFTCSEIDAFSLIRSTHSKDRNCKISKGSIGLKPNYGNLVVENKINKIVKIRAGKAKPTQADVFSNDITFLGISQDTDFIMRKMSLLKKIDKISRFDPKYYRVDTPFGTCDITQISTGLKTVLNAAYIAEKKPLEQVIINANECGNNVLPYLFEVVAGTNIVLYFSHSILYNGKDYEFEINGHKSVNILNLFKYL